MVRELLQVVSVGLAPMKKSLMKPHIGIKEMAEASITRETLF